MAETTTFLQLDYSEATHDREERWVSLVEQAQGLMNTRENDKGIKLMARGLAERAVSQEYGFTESEMDSNERSLVEAVTNIYVQVNQKVKKEQIAVEPGFARDVYLEVIPALLSVNRISTEFNNSSGYNSIDQAVSFAVSVMRAPSLRGSDKSFVIFGQMCAQYNSGASHESESFSRGLLPEINDEKVDKMFTPIGRIGTVLKKHEVPTRIVTAQLSADPQNMLAMVPATVWSYVDTRDVAGMLSTLDRHASHMDSSIKRALSVNGSSEYTHVTQSYSEHEGSDSLSIMERTLRLADIYTEPFRQWQQQNGRGHKPSIEHWTEIEVKDLKDFIREMDKDWTYDRVMAATKSEYMTRTGGEYPEDIFRSLHLTMREPSWGTLTDTEKFYAREVQQRANAQATDWHHRVDRESEVNHLVGNPDFYPNHPPTDRSQKAEELIAWVETIANIGIGSRAIFNTALYASLGHELAMYNRSGHVAVMWPMEEDTDKFAIDAMNKMYQYVLNGKGKGDVIPCIYPSKEWRQPVN